MKVIVLLMCLWLCLPVAYANESQLQLVDDLRLSDQQKAYSLYKDINPASLSVDERLHYRYLEGFFTTYFGRLDEAYSLYEKLYADSVGKPIQLRVLVSMLGVASYANKWKESFEIADKLDQRLKEFTNSSDKVDAFRGLLTFHRNVEQPKIALTYVDRLLSEPTVSEVDICFARTIGNEIRLGMNSPELSAGVLSAAVQMCESVGQTYYAAFNQLILFKFYLSKEHWDSAQDLVPALESAIQKVDFIYFTTSYMPALAKLYLHNGNLDEAERAAQRTFELDTEGQYKPSLLLSYEVLANVAKARGDYQAALQYAELRQNLREEFFSENKAKALAIQEARFDLNAKEAQIALQEKQITLAEQRVTNIFLAFVMVAIMLIGAAFWLYRGRKVQNKLRDLARTDSLTGLYNRGYFTEKSKSILFNAQRNESIVTLLFLDLDHFKRINDTYGHQVGDWVLREVVRALTETCDPDTLIGRMGGEEFAILLDNANAKAGLMQAEKCRKAIEAVDTWETGHRFKLTASFGVCDTSLVGYKLDNLASAADLALYQSKQYGRNQVYEYNAELKPI